jgi:hypothetical protein
MVVFRIDISAARDFRADTIVRDAFPPDAVPALQFLDPSPYTIWLSFDWHVWDSLRHGRLPLWERLQGGGYSPVVALQGGVLHPVRWLATLAPRELMPGVLMVLSLALAIAGWVLYGAWAQLQPVSIAAGALLFAFSPQIISFADYSGALLALAHLPWVVLLTRRTASGYSRWRFVALALACGSLLTAGHPLMEMTVCLAAGTFALGDAIVSRRIRPLMIVFAGVACGTLLALATLLPPIVAQPEMWSYKTTTDHGRAYVPRTLDVWWQMLWYVGADAHLDTCCVDIAPFWSHLGWPAILLLMAAALAKSRKREATILLSLSFLWFLIIAPGPWMQVLRVIPPLGMAKDWYYSGAFAFVMSATAAMGFDALQQSSRRYVRWAATALALAAIATYAIRSLSIFSPTPWEPVVRGAAVETLRAKEEAFRVTGFIGQTHVPNTARVTGVEDVRLSAPFFSRRFREWWLLVDPYIDRKSYPTTPMTDALDSPLVDDFNIRYVLQSRWMPTGWFHSAMNGVLDKTLSPRLVDPEFPLAMRTRSLEVRENNGWRPRASFAEAVVRVPDLDNAIRTLRRDPDLPRRASVVEAATLPALPPRAGGRVTVHYPSDAEVVLQTDSATGGLVVLRDTFAAGWTAQVDGKDAPIYAVNVLSRGVVVPPGRHRITMSYMPPGLIAGAAIAMLTLAGLLLFAISGRRAAESRN